MDRILSTVWADKEIELYRFFPPPLAGIGKLPALAGQYFGIILVLLCMSFFAYLMVFTRFHITQHYHRPGDKRQLKAQDVTAKLA